MIYELEQKLRCAIFDQTAIQIGKTGRSPEDDFSWAEYYEWQGEIYRVGFDSQGDFMNGLSEAIPLRDAVRQPHARYINREWGDRLRLREYQQKCGMKRGSE